MSKSALRIFLVSLSFFASVFGWYWFTWRPEWIRMSCLREADVAVMRGLDNSVQKFNQDVLEPMLEATSVKYFDSERYLSQNQLNLESISSDADRECLRRHGIEN